MPETLHMASQLLSPVLSVIAIVVSLRALKHSKRSADASERSAAEAKTANALTQEQMRITAAEKAEERAANAVILEIVKVKGTLFGLRNTGRETAYGVNIVTPMIKGWVVHDLPVDAEIPPGVALRFSFQGTGFVEKPPYLDVIWQGRQSPVAVPLPR